MSGIAGFRAAITLEPIGEDVFLARTQTVPWAKSYGGDLLAQAAAAAMRTVAPDRALHATHSLFVAPATVGGSIEYRVERLRDGKSYSSRRVTGAEGGRVVLSALCSFHVGETSDLLSESAPDVEGPTGLATSAEWVSGLADPAAAYWAHGRGFDIRHLGLPLYAQPTGERAREVRYWARAFEALPDEADAHRLALIYLCDYGMLEPALRASGLAWTDPGLTTASLDHAMWFHADARADEWLLCSIRLVSHSRGRALVKGDYFSEAGVHVASVAQQGMIRRPAAVDGS
ncbi:acyl-CoA thioesterase [Microbacterium album]|uniref:Acyl-CoA thioesterase II n=1 Tax=Microbacterium album TaxID=2053191 RepID=A0A917IFC0_9MICO|nr:acyl-CoA thioesterase domain-containing protein [Microbacterium album]GGH43042.1 acyl-CoA thioesterase II [Microbacterium album]